MMPPGYRIVSKSIKPPFSCLTSAIINQPLAISIAGQLSKNAYSDSLGGVAACVCHANETVKGNEREQDSVLAS